MTPAYAGHSVDDRSPAMAVEGRMAQALAARLAANGYQVRFPPGRDPAVFKVTGLPGDPDVEVSAEDDGSASCHYTGRATAEAATVIGRLPVPGHPQVQTMTADTLTATWDGIGIEWHYLPAGGKPAGVDQVAVVLLAHLAVLGGGHPDGEDAPR
jgi:hypothetical protein